MGTPTIFCVTRFFFIGAIHINLSTVSVLTVAIRLVLYTARPEDDLYFQLLSFELSVDPALNITSSLSRAELKYAKKQI